MQTYKAFMKMTLKAAPAAMIFFVIFMVVSAISASQGASSDEEMYKDVDIRFAVFNRDDSELGESLKNYLSKKNEYIDVEDDEQAIRLSLYYRSVYYILVIPEGFEDAMINGNDMEIMNYKVSDSAQGYYMDMEVESYIQTLKSYIAAGYDIDKATEKTEETLLNNVDVTLLASLEDKEIDGNPISQGVTTEKPAIYYFYQYVPYAFMAVVITALGPILITFGKKDIKMRISVSAQTLKSYGLQMFLGVVTFGVVILSLFNILAVLLYGSALSFAAMVYYIILTLCFLLVCLGITYFGGFLFGKGSTMAAFANVVSLGMSFIGGIFVPLELLDNTMQTLAKFTPTYWYIQANNAIINVEKFSDMDIDLFAKNCGVQLLFAVAFFCIGLAILKQKRAEA